MRPSPRPYPDDLFTLSPAARLRVAGSWMWWRWPRARRLVVALLICGTVTAVVTVVAGHPGSPSHCTLYPVKGGAEVRSCR